MSRSDQSLASDEPFDLEAAVPAELRDRPQWVCWRYERRGEGKPTKVPVNAATDGPASSTDPATWTTFVAARDAAAKRGYAGVGFVFTEDDAYCGIDLDECIAEGELTPEAADLIKRFGTYTETSPSGNGVKLFLKGHKPEGAKCASSDFDGAKRVEIYDRARFFTVTGQRVATAPGEVVNAQNALDDLCRRLWPPSPASAASPLRSHIDSVPMTERERRCLAYVEKCPDAISGERGHDKTLRVACECYRFGLDDDSAMRVMSAFNASKTGGEQWNEHEIQHKLASARQKVEQEGEVGVRLAAASDNRPPSEAAVSPVPLPAPLSVGELVAGYPDLRPPIIHGLLRAGETMNVIAAPKTGKSWLTIDLAIAVATGEPWLGVYETVPGDVLIIDNELHRETSGHRIPMVAAARDVSLDRIADRIFVDNLRGRLQDIFTLGPYFAALEPGRFKVIVLDAFYRFMPAGGDENDNGTMANIYNRIDAFADRLGCCFVLIHHSTKGSQTGKSVTDIGAGAGAQSRATDTHLVLRPHEEDGVVVLDAAVRSWKPVEPMCLRWDFPVWTVEDGLDPASLKNERAGKRREPKARTTRPEKPSWDVDKFVKRFISAEPVGKAEIREAAKDEPGLSWRRVADLLEIAESRKLIYRWRVGSAHKVLFATVPQPDLSLPMVGEAGS